MTDSQCTLGEGVGGRKEVLYAAFVVDVVEGASGATGYQ
jgi:hypothetical protein